MIRLLKLSAPLIVFMIIAIFLWRGLHINPHKIPSPLLGKSLPAFRAENLLEPEASVTDANLKGQVTLLNVFATWCATCQAEHPILMDIAREHGVRLVGLDYKDSRTKAMAWLKSYGNPYSMVISDPLGKLGISLGVYGTPETFVIDKNGIIRYKYIGGLSPNVWHDTLKPQVEKWRV